MRKANKRRPDRTRYRRAGIAKVGRNKGRARFVVTRGRYTAFYYAGTAATVSRPRRHRTTA